MAWLRRYGVIAAAGGLMLAAFALAAWSSSSIFERLPHTEDEVTFLFQAKTIAEGNLIAPGPEHPEFFRMSFVINRDGYWFGKYPPGYPLVLALGALAGATWLVNAAAAAIAVGLVIAVGRRFYDRRTALLAGTLLAFSPFAIVQSGALLSHVVALCWVLLMVLCFDIARSRAFAPAALGFGVATGMLLLTRPLTAVGITLPFVVIACIDLLRRRPLLGRYLLMALGTLPFVALLLAYNEATTGSPLRSAYELWWSYDRLGFGPEYGVNGHSLSDAIRNTRSNLDDLSKVLFGWPGRLSLLPAALAACAAAWSLRRRGFTRATSADLLLAGIVVSLIAAHMLYWTPGKMYGPRYYFEGIGALALLSARGLIWLWDLVSAGAASLGKPLRLARFATPAVLVVLAAYAMTVTLPAEADRYRGWNNVHRRDLQALESQDLDDALVFVPRPNWQTYAPLFLENATTLDSDVIYAVDRGDQDNPTLMREYLDRDYYRYADGRLEPLAPPQPVGHFRHATPLD